MKKIEKLLVLICFIAIAHVNAQDYKMPKHEKFTLSNGLTVYLMEQRDVPVISVNAILPAGAISDGNKAGLASLTASALKHGTTSFTKSDIDEKLDFIGASVSISASKEYANLSSKFASKDQKIVMSIIMDLLRNPTFNEEEFKKEKSRLLVSLDQQKESPNSVIGSYFNKLLFGNHVYGNISSGTKESVDKLTIDDIKTFYKNNYTPNNSAISIVGDFDSKEMRNDIRSLFSGWKKSNNLPKNLASNPITTPTSQKVLLVNKEDASETTFYIGGAGVSRNNKDYVAIQVINTLFGGRFTSMLNTELRINSGLTYGARSSFANYKYGGSFYISTFTANKTSEQAIDLALDVLTKLHTNDLDQNLLTSAKNYVKGQFPPRYETVDQLSGLLTQMFWFNFDESFINNFEKNVDELDVQKAKKIIETYFPKEKLQFVLVGKASEIKSIVSKYGKVEQVEIKDGINQ